MLSVFQCFFTIHPTNFWKKNRIEPKKNTSRSIKAFLFSWFSMVSSFYYCNLETSPWGTSQKWHDNIRKTYSKFTRVYYQALRVWNIRRKQKPLKFLKELILAEWRRERERDKKQSKLRTTVVWTIGNKNKFWNHIFDIFLKNKMFFSSVAGRNVAQRGEALVNPKVLKSFKEAKTSS